MNDETLIFGGGAIKALGDGKWEGPLILFTGPEQKDLSSDFFTDSTDYWLDFPARVPLLYGHGMDATIKKTRLGEGTAELEKRDAGVWMKGQMDLSDKYQSAIYSLMEQGRMGSSSGSSSHLVERKSVGDAYEMLSWPIVEASLTVEPCQPLNRAVMPLKSWIQGNPETPEFKAVMTTAAGYAPPNNRAPTPPPTAPPPFQNATGRANAANAANPGRDSGSTECPACHLYCHFDADHKECPYCGQTLTLSADGVPLENSQAAGKSFGDELDAALAAVEGCADRAAALKDLRVKDGRTLSASTQSKIQDLSERLVKLLAGIKPEDLGALQAQRNVLDMTILEAQMAVYDAERAADLSALLGALDD